MATSGIEVEGFLSSVVLEVCVGSTEISSSWGSANEGLVDVELNAWDNSSAPRTDWDAMVDNCEERKYRVGTSTWKMGAQKHTSGTWSLVATTTKMDLNLRKIAQMKA